MGIAIGVIEAGLCKTVAIFRSMNGYSQVRIGGTGRSSGRSTRSGDALFGRAFGQASAAELRAHGGRRLRQGHPVAERRRRARGRAGDRRLRRLRWWNSTSRSGRPGEHDGLRVTGNLVDENGDLAPEAPGPGYDDLAIADGNLAAARYQRALASTDQAQRQQTFADLRAYCQRDTLATLELRKALVVLAQSA